ncbi:hypothetical protein LWM68_08580 [Niabella sp. W65]|nr:hypothetical protein [Niabella sp. W65]MCH7362819.1 hypothetical protein [Niabella sp. W65]ULT38774.1 hypothetical protein KRR40_27270 [Niabella sp. I65]
MVNQAELRIVDSNYQKALELYMLAFREHQFHFSHDLYNASVCATETGKTKVAMQLCMELSKKGVGANFFLKKSVYQSLKSNKNWTKLLSKSAQVKNDQALKYGAIRRVLDSLVEKDQQVNHEWRNSGMDKQKRLIMDLTYDTISRHLSKLFDTYGFLSEDKIGTYVEDDTVLRIGLPFDVIIIHNYEARMVGDTLFNPVLRMALRNKIIKPDYYARMHDFVGADSTNFFGSSHIYIQYKCTLYRETKPFLSFDKIEAARKRIGMSSLADFERKLKYKLENKKASLQFMLQYRSMAALSMKSLNEFTCQHYKSLSTR